jgi:hypothetical protein
MPPLFAALIAAALTIGFFAFFTAKVKSPWLRNTLIVVATVFSLGLSGVLAGSNERAELTGQIYLGIVVVSYLAWKFLSK